MLQAATWMLRRSRQRRKESAVDDGYSDAFSGGDNDDSSIVEHPSPEDTSSPDDTDANNEDSGVTLLSLAEVQHRHVHLAEASAELPSSADAFAEFEKNSIASLQRNFEAQMQRGQSKHDKLMQKQSSLNAEKESLEALHSRLASIVAQLEGRHTRLQLRVRSIGDLVQHLAMVAREPEEQAVAALRSMRPLSSS